MPALLEESRRTRDCRHGGDPRSQLERAPATNGRAISSDRLHATLDAAAALDLPVFIGTEMNKPGQLQIDDLKRAGAARLC